MNAHDTQAAAKVLHPRVLKAAPVQPQFPGAGVPGPLPHAHLSVQARGAGGTRHPKFLSILPQHRLSPESAVPLCRETGREMGWG